MMIMQHRRRQREQDEAARKIQNAWRSRKDGNVNLFGSKKMGKKHTSLTLAGLKQANARIEMRGRIREIALYVAFLFFFTVSSILTVQDQDIYHFGNNIRNQFTGVEFRPEHAHVLKTFFDTATVNEFWQWVQGPFYDFVYTGSSTNGKVVKDDPGFVFYDNRIIGGIRIGSLRAKERDCVNMPAWQQKDMKCYGAQSGAFPLDTEDHAEFGSGTKKWKWNGEGWGTLQVPVEDERAMMLSNFRTNEGRVFPTPAFSVILPNDNATEARSTITTLINDAYIDRQTKAVMVDTTFYNPNMDFFCFTRASMETGKSGGVRVAFHVATVRLYTLFESPATSRIFLEIIVIFFFAYYIAVEIIKGCKKGVQYFFTLENALHNLNLVLYLVVWFFRFASYITTPDATKVDVSSADFYLYSMPTMHKRISIYINSLNAFLCWFKLVRFLGYIPRFALVTGTLARSARGITGFTVIFMVLFYGFAAAHMMTFGTQLDGYKNLTHSAITLLQSLLGDFDLAEMVEAQFIMGPLFFIIFTAVAVFVVLNILIAIISDAYTDETKALSEESDVQIGEELRLYVKHKVMENPVLAKIFCVSAYGMEKVVQVKDTIQSKAHIGGSRGSRTAALDDEGVAKVDVVVSETKEEVQPIYREEAREARPVKRKSSGGDVVEMMPPGAVSGDAFESPTAQGKDEDDVITDTVRKADASVSAEGK